MSLMCKFINEDINNTNCPKEYSNFLEVVERSPVDYLLNVRFLGKLTFVGTVMANNNDLRCAKHHLVTGESTATMLHLLDDLICALKVFPNELPDARIVRMYFVAAMCLVSHGWAMDGNIVNERYCSVGNLRLQDGSNIIMEHQHQVCLSHWKCDETVCTE